MKDNDNYITDYECEEMGFCNTCFWSNGEQCIRQLLTEGDIEEILEAKRDYKKNLK